MQRDDISKAIVILIGALCIYPALGSAEALLSGLFIAICLSNPFPTKKYTHTLLGISVAGLGAGMNLDTVARVGIEGLGITFISITAVCLMGYALMKLLRVEEEVGTLITVGTAICGGSAIAAATPVIEAKSHSVSVALGTVFILNALALLIFPPIGHLLSMPESDFGLWSALAIHDTSSVVGATVTYGKVAAEVGTTIKLARALWIVPLTLALSFLVRRTNPERNISPKKPWFIAWFLVAAAIVTWIPALQPVGDLVAFGAKRLLVLTLFLIGLGLSKDTLKSVGIRPFVMGVVLWLLTGALSLVLIQKGYI